MNRHNRPYPPFLLIIIVTLLASCTPSPRYKGGGTAGSQAPRNKEQRREKPHRGDIDIVLRNPLGGTGGTRINSPFGVRSRSSYGTKEFHQGIDLEADTGDAVYAAAAGRVTYAGRQKGYGRVIIIDHGNDISTVYAHLSATLVHRDDIVEAGQHIGKVGLSGNARGSHLHFELRISGEAVDPLDYMEIR
jgi:murein DD-endopeptidase MepM/ murein hydrolase activator NlpD